MSCYCMLNVVVCFRNVPVISKTLFVLLHIRHENIVARIRSSSLSNNCGYFLNMVCCSNIYQTKTGKNNNYFNL